MKQKAVFLALSLCGIALAVYCIARFVRSLERSDWGFSRESMSKAESISDGFFVAVFTPDKKEVRLQDGSLIAIPDLWVEQSWKYTLNTFLVETKQACEGYNVKIPFSPEKVVDANGNPRFSFRMVSEVAGVGYDERKLESGFFTHIPKLGKTLGVQIIEKGIDWTKPVVIESVEFKRSD